jgi:hypothetical protein
MPGLRGGTVIINMVMRALSRRTNTMGNHYLTHVGLIQRERA